MAESITVQVATYLPTDDRDPKHWAIWLQSSDKQVLLQVSDDKGGVGYYVEKPIYDKPPQRSSKHDESIKVGKLAASTDLDTAVALIDATPVDNESKTWNCQAWVVEALDSLAKTEQFHWEGDGREELIKRRQDWQ